MIDPEIAALREMLDTAMVVRDDARRVAQVRLDEKRELEAEVGRLRELLARALDIADESSTGLADDHHHAYRAEIDAARAAVVPPREDGGHG